MNLRHLDLNLLRVFDAVYRTGSNTKAGGELGLTQSAVSNAIRRLREQLNDPLFERSNGVYGATAEAHRLAPVIRDALKTLEQTLAPGAEFDPGSSSRRFSMIIPGPIELLIMPPLIREVTENAYGVGFDLYPMAGASPVKDLLERKVDFAFLPNPVLEDNICSDYLFDDDAVVVARRDHPLLGNLNELTKEDMARVGLVTLTDEMRKMTHLEHELRAARVNRRFVATVSKLSSIPNIVATTDLAGALPRLMAEDVAKRFDLKLLPLSVDRPTHHWNMIWHEAAREDEAMTWLRARICALFADN